MFLSSLSIKNYRSLEDVRLEELGRFNVLIGRNNSGKSSVFGALQLLSNRVRQGNINMSRVLTDLDPNRSLEIVLTFKPRPEEREEYIDLLCAGVPQGNRRQEMLDSALLRQIEYRFAALPGQPELLHLLTTRVRTEDGQYATAQKMTADPLTNNPASTMANVDAIRNRAAAITINTTLMDFSTAANVSGSSIVELDLFTEMRNFAQQGSVANLPITLWPQHRLVEFLGDAFFFDPFRHSAESGPAQSTPELLQDGSNLAQVLFTLNVNERGLFDRVEEFIQGALPDIGALETRVEGSTTMVSFDRPAGGHEVLLREMGSGIEQLLMTATVLVTTGEESTLFIEEPESHLHAGAQRFLIERLYEGNRQVFLTTHSPTFVNVSRPRSLYQIVFLEGRARLHCFSGADSLGTVLEDIGARNSDVLLSDAVLFVEGSTDVDALYAWSKTLGTSLEDSNVTVLPMGGGRNAEGKARVRSEILEGISEQAPVPHLLLLDRDERGPIEIKRLKRDLGDRVHLLERREIENYLMAPRAILESLLEKRADGAAVSGNVEIASPESVQLLLETTAESLYGLVLLKRIRSALEGLKDGLLPTPMLEELVPLAGRKDLAKRLRGKMRSRVEEHIANLDIAEVVDSEREALEKEWSNPEKRLELAPGEEVLAAVFENFGTQLNKSTDTARIASKMRKDDIPVEIKSLIDRVISLAATEHM